MSLPRPQLLLAFAAVAALALPQAGTAQAVRGTLLLADSEVPLSFGKVELLDGQMNVIASTFSDALGRFVIRAPRPGTFSLRGTHMSAAELVAPGVRLAIGDVIDVEFALPVKPIELDPLTVTVPPERQFLMQNGFYERAETTLGTFFTPERLERLRPDRPTDLLRQLPGVQLTPDPVDPSRHSIRFSRTGGLGGFCRPKIVVDAVTMVDFDIDEIPSEVVAAVEIYKSALDTPPQYAGRNAACGTIVIWTGSRVRQE